MSKRSFRIAIAAAAIALFSGRVEAQDYPSRPITLIVPFAAGGPADAIARLVAEKMSATLKQNFVIENMGGAGGTLAAARVARSEPDGHTLMVYNQGFAAGPALYSKLPYDVVKNFRSLGLISYGPMVLVGRKDFPAKDAKELVELLKHKSKDLTFAHAGIGGVAHLCGLILSSRFNAQMPQVAYRGGSQAMQDLMGGSTDLYCGLWDTFDPIQTGMIKGYAVLGTRRFDVLPDVPTFAELGFDDLELNAWYGLFAPAAIPEAVVGKINQALRTALTDPELKHKLALTGSYIFSESEQTPQAAAAFFEKEVERLGKVVRDNKVKLD